MCGCLFGCFLDPSSSFISFQLFSDFTLGLQGDDPKGREGPGERCPETSLTCTHSASELGKTRDRIKSPPLILSVPQLACSLGSLLLSLSLQLLSSPIFWHQGFSRTGGLEIHWTLNSGPSTFKPCDLKQSVFSESVSSSVK